MLSFFSPFVKKSKTVAVTIQKKFTPNKINCQTGYQLLTDGNIVFVFRPWSRKTRKARKVTVEGSFTGWNKKSDSQWEMLRQKKLWTLTVPYDKIKIPGNSGFPEFKFLIEYKAANNKTITLESDSICRIPGFTMSTNNLVIPYGTDPQTVAENCIMADTEKKLCDFDLTDKEQQAIISNVRQVPGTIKLWRGYHPYKMSRPQMDTEEIRIKLVKQSLLENNINSIITLSGDEDPIAGKEEISPRHQEIRNNENQLFINTSYEEVYFNSNGKEFGTVIQTIVRFINSHKGNYYIHCRLGTDRTGTCSAVLAALCGASWEEIAADYQKTNLCGIKEFRDYRLLQHCFEGFLNKPIKGVKDLKAETSAYFADAGYLTYDEIRQLNVQLCQ